MTQVRIHQTNVPNTSLSPKKALRVRGPIDAALDVELFRALGDPTRLVLLACLAKCARPCSVGEVAECCRVDLSVVSRHLSLMSRAGLLEARKEGRVVRYSVRFAHFTGALRTLADAIDHCAAAGCCTSNDAPTGAARTQCACTSAPASSESPKPRRVRTGTRHTRSGAST